MADPLGDLRDEFALDAANHLDPRLLLGHRGHPLELAGDQGALLLHSLPEGFQLRLAPRQPLFVGVELSEPALEALLALGGALLKARDLRAALADLSLGLVATAGRFLFRRQEHGLRLLLSGTDLLEAPFSIGVLRHAALRHGLAGVNKSRSRKSGRNNHQPYQGKDLGADWVEPRRSGATRPAWDASHGEGNRDETRSVSMIRLGPARFWPVVLHGRQRSLYEPKGLLACFDGFRAVPVPLTCDQHGGRQRDRRAGR